MRCSIIFLGLCAWGLGSPVFAAQLTINPPLLDVAAEERDIITKDISVTNTTEQKLIVYATVNEIAVDEEGQLREFISPVMTDQTMTVTSWIEITRGRIEILPGETYSVPITLRINPNAKPGEYHAFIGFVPTSKRPTAEATALAGDAQGVILKVSLQDNASESLRIVNFVIDRLIYKDVQRTVNVEIENNGDVPSTAQGEVIFYNSRGEEVASQIINNENVLIPPGEKKIFTTTVPFLDRLGRFKANLTLHYSGSEQAAVFDTVYFFMVPFRWLLAFGIVIVFLSIIVTYLIRRTFYDELHEDDDGVELPLYVRNDREHEQKDHDITLQKKNE